MWKLSSRQDISGESLRLAAKVLGDRWKARGMDPKVLATVRTQVFNIGEPPEK